ncbi:hypothetical protein SAMN05443550_1361 [Pedobacter hartonius]|uniref:Uncharacterized protein n=2 Tax=Pedobacter hartonius TaxID=425514 RepID=A0A1H4HMX7_9SPHI|nr:hypothetical protein SAMN05443550_1361 [Pedobacter hartonius]
MKFFFLIIVFSTVICTVKAQKLTAIGKVSTQTNSYNVSKDADAKSPYPLKVVNIFSKFTNVKPTRSGYAKDEMHILPVVIFNIKRKDLKNVLTYALDRNRWESLSDESFFIDCFVNDGGMVEDVVFYLKSDTKLTAIDLEKIESAFKTKFQAKITHAEFKGTFNYLPFGDSFTVKEILAP